MILQLQKDAARQGLGRQKHVAVAFAAYERIPCGQRFEEGRRGSTDMNTGLFLHTTLISALDDDRPCKLHVQRLSD